MSSWWQRTPGVPDPPPAAHSERRNPLTFVDDSDEREWTQVGELDPRTGQWTTPPRPGWERQVGGWRQLSDWLRG